MKTILPLCLFGMILIGEPLFGEAGSTGDGNVRIRFIKGEDEVVFQMSDNAAGRDFLALLPLTMVFEDYARTEKVADPPSELSTADAPAGYDPEIGDLCLYAPWGNLCIFYRDFGYSRGLVKLGHAVSGGGLITRLEGPVRIEAVE